MNTNICSFIFNAMVTKIAVHVTGVERTWDFLKLEFERHGDGLPSPTARYYQTLYAGPKLFGVDNDTVYYHDKEVWTRYVSARDIKYSYDPDFTDDENECDEVYSSSSSNLHLIETLRKREMSQTIALWYYQNNENIVIDIDKKDRWILYSDIENEIIEEAFQHKATRSSLVELDDCLVDFDQRVQISKSDDTGQQAIKRVIKAKNEERHFLHERFSEPLPLVSLTASSYGQGNQWSPFIAEWMQSQMAKKCIFSPRKCLQMAKKGICIEGRLVGKEIQASYLLKELEMCPRLTMKDISKYFVHLFTRASFLYRVMNAALRANDMSKIDTLGPCCYLLRAFIRTTGAEYSGCLYRGCDLSEEQVNEYRDAIAMKEWKTWPSFTSTSKCRQTAELYVVNTLFTINVREVGMCSIRAYHIEHLSQFPDEEEVLLPAGVLFQVLDVTEDEKTKKWIIYLQL